MVLGHLGASCMNPRLGVCAHHSSGLKKLQRSWMRLTDEWGVWASMNQISSRMDGEKCRGQKEGGVKCILCSSYILLPVLLVP